MPQLIAEARKRQAGTQFGSAQRSVPDDTDREDTEGDMSAVEPSFRSRQAAAEMADVSQQTIQRAWEVTKADPELAKEGEGFVH